ncbi:RNA polymerase sigma factor [Aneurinibacillus soli]|uniref:RNA polymerase sigma factor SigI n=1 Tax=Aneurinibacillus soli TaxID=1500254 RepID=A0A0U4WDA8_9BACL|nr:RNA polymerase sigma-I factor [Aneurinibacillus soli]PYE60872.1 RNA polymerase sigma factor [Aneurinibacillus soli]BAU26777.1 RNA polymerase sigma factor SigI [Aneurinibacillus soli]
MLLTLFLGKWRRKSQTPRENDNQHLYQLIERIHQGEDEWRNELLEQYRPFIGTAVSKVCKRYIHQSQDEEFSIGLEAFNEAITGYSVEKGSSFLSFADLVIRRRVIDFIRKNRQRISMVSLDESADPQAPEYNVWDVQAAVERHQLEQEAEYRREEIFHYRERLQQFEIELEDLPDYTPQHADARINMIHIARIIAEKPELRQSFLEKKKIPVKYLLQYITFSRKTVERNRNYIVAITVLFIEDYQYLRSYIQTEDIEGKGEPRDEEGHRAQAAGSLLDCDDAGRGIS